MEQKYISLKEAAEKWGLEIEESILYVYRVKYKEHLR